MNNKLLIIVPIILIVLLGIILYICINIRTINYIDGSKTYNIKLINNKVIVKFKQTVMCITDPCPEEEVRIEIKFSKKNNKIIKDFIIRKTGIKKKKNIKREELSEYELKIMESIIFNDEDLLIKESISEKEYVIETDMKLKTMRNDGGSNTNIYYIIDLDNKKVTKKEEDYYAPENDLKKKTIYKKTIDEELAKKAKEVINESISKSLNENTTNNFYTIKHNKVETYIYNKDLINSLEELLLDLDYY